MKLKIYFFLALTLGIASTLAAQDVKKADITGKVVDEEQVPLSDATLMLLNATDSTIIGFTASDLEGGFIINNIKSGAYHLKLNYLGYVPQYVDLTIGDTDIEDLGTIEMVPAPEVLGEVEITADYVPIEISGDTIGYNADAFQTQPNAAVEDLLKKLPGVEVDQDGNIKAQGEDVQNVLVDGKEFFGSDPKIATKNLPADAIKKIQVYDRKSDAAEFSGVDDGQTQKTINLTLKDGMKGGFFGNAEAGYGTDNRYKAKATINRFNKKSQLSFLGLANNVNEQGFSVNEFVNFSGGMSAMRSGGNSLRRGGQNSTVPISNGLSDGLARTLAGGINYNVELGKKIDLRTNYFFNGLDNTVTQNRFRQDFVNDTLGNTGTIESNTDSENRTKSNGHRFNANLEYDIDSTQNLRFRSSTAFGDGSYESNDMTETFRNDGTQGNSSISEYNSESDNFNFDGSLAYRKKFGGKKGRVLTLDGKLYDGTNSSDGNLVSFNKFFESGRENLINQRQTQKSDNSRWSAGASYTEPLASNKYIKFNYEYQANDNLSDKSFYDIDTMTGQETLDTLLSTRFNQDIEYHRVGATFQLNTSKITLSAGLQYQDTDMRGVINNSETPITRTVGSFLPEVRFRYNIATSKSIRFNYETDINLPSLEQLSPIVDNSDPLRIYLGNPDLEEEYQHSSVLRFISFNQFSSTSLFAQLRGTYTTNKIINSSFINSDLIEVTTPVNIDSDWRLTAYAAFSKPINKIRMRVRVNGNTTYNRSQVFINQILNNLDRWNHVVGVSLQSMNSDVFEYTFGADWTYNTTAYSESSNINQNFFIQHYYTDLSVNFLKTWRLSTSFDVRFFSGEQFNGDETLPLWEASLSKFVFKDQRGEIKLTAFDILNENRGIKRNANANYLEEVVSNSLSQYFMLSFIYKLKGMGQEARVPSWMNRRNR